MEIFRALAALVEPPAAEHRRLLELLDLLDFGEPPSAAEYSRVFLFQLYPYASVYLGEEGMLGGEARDRIAGFWRALGESPPAEPDHLAVMLALWARLGELEAEAGEPEQAERWRHARRVFLWEHLLSWLPLYVDKLQQIAPPIYANWGRMLLAELVSAAVELGAAEELPAHLRGVPPLADPREAGGEALLASLLAPARCGMILVRTDLERAAEKLELGLRQGERRYALKALLGQDSGTVLNWLSTEAGRAAERARQWPEPLAVVAEFWAERAEWSRDLLSELAREAVTA